MSACFGRELRLLKPADFKQVFDQVEIKVPHPHLLMLVRRNGLDHPRVGLVIAKRNVKLAVHRNRVKRVIRETFRLTQDDLSGLDIVVLALRGLGEQDNPTLHQLLHKQWQRLRKRAAAVVTNQVETR